MKCHTKAYTMRWGTLSVDIHRLVCPRSTANLLVETARTQGMCTAGATRHSPASCCHILQSSSNQEILIHKCVANKSVHSSKQTWKEVLLFPYLKDWFSELAYNKCYHQKQKLKAKKAQPSKIPEEPSLQGSSEGREEMEAGHLLHRLGSLFHVSQQVRPHLQRPEDLLSHCPTSHKDWERHPKGGAGCFTSEGF